MCRASPTPALSIQTSFDESSSIKASSAKDTETRALCEYFKNDRCRMGDACRFAHSLKEFKQPHLILERRFPQYAQHTSPSTSAATSTASFRRCDSAESTVSDKLSTASSTPDIAPQQPGTSYSYGFFSKSPQGQDACPLPTFPHRFEVCENATVMSQPINNGYYRYNPCYVTAAQLQAAQPAYYEE